VNLRLVKTALSVTGMALAVLALAIDEPQLTWVAIAVLAVAVGLRFIIKRRESED
jgi:hypothetical protein